jgi:integrase
VHPRTGIYQFRRAVPQRLRPLIGKREVKISLGTRDAAVARRLHAEIAAQVDADWFERERSYAMGEAAPLRLTQEQVVALSGRLYRQVMDQHGKDPGEEVYWLRRLQRIQCALPPARRTLPAGITWYPIGPSAMLMVGGQVAQLLAAEGLEVDWESRNRLHAAGALALAQAYRELAKRAGGDFSPDPDAHRFSTETPPPQLGGQKSVPWRVVHEAYCAEMKPSPATVKRQLGVLQAFFSFLGHENMAKVTKGDCDRWIEHRLGLVSARTVRDADMAHPKTLFIWAKRKKRVDHQPFEDSKVVVPNAPQLRDREFDQEEAEAILTASLVPPSSRMTVDGAASRRWVPWICCYTGARVNEVTQARAEDIAQRKSQDGSLVWCIRLTPEAGTVKNATARWVALHPHLIEQGFLHYVASRQGMHLFYDPARRRDGTAANPQYKKVGERLAHWVRHDVGITDTGVDPNHGWRHLFRSNLLAADVQEQVINRIDGHAGKTVGQSYGTAWPQVMLTAISRIPPYRLGGRV